MPLNNEASERHSRKSNHAYKPARVEINRVGIAGFVNSKSSFFCKFTEIACKWLWDKDLRRGAGEERRNSLHDNDL